MSIRVLNIEVTKWLPFHFGAKICAACINMAGGLFLHWRKPRRERNIFWDDAIKLVRQKCVVWPPQHFRVWWVCPSTQYATAGSALREFSGLHVVAVSVQEDQQTQVQRLAEWWPGHWMHPNRAHHAVDITPQVSTSLQQREREWRRPVCPRQEIEGEKRTCVR